MLADLSAYGLRTNDKASLDQLLGSLPEETNFAYVYVLDAQRKVVAERYLAPALRDGVIPPLDSDELPERTGPTRHIDRVVPEGHYLELVTPVAALASGYGTPLPDANNATGGAATGVAATTGPLGYVRLGMTFDLQRRLLVDQLQGALAVVAVLVIVAVTMTLLLTRRLVAPMRRLMRAARAVGAGRLDVCVPARSSDELGLLTHTFNHMTQTPGASRRHRSRTTSARSRTRSRSARKRARDRHRARVQARAARHPHRAAQPVAAQPAPEADPRAGTARQHARRLPVPRLRPLQAHQRHARPRRRRPAAAGDRAAPRRRGARERHGRAAGRRRIRRRDLPGLDPAHATVRGDDGARARARVVPRAVPAVRPDARR